MIPERRTAMSNGAPLIFITPTIVVDRDQQLITRYHRTLFLPARTWHLLAYLLDHPHRLIADVELIRVGWPHEMGHMHRIRQAIEPDPRHPRILLTRREVGYLLALPPFSAEKKSSSP
jgi:DNA-binding response OmpR family regulator